MSFKKRKKYKNLSNIGNNLKDSDPDSYEKLMKIKRKKLILNFIREKFQINLPRPIEVKVIAIKSELFYSISPKTSNLIELYFFLNNLIASTKLCKPLSTLILPM